MVHAVARPYRNERASYEPRRNASPPRRERPGRLSPASRTRPRRRRCDASGIPPVSTAIPTRRCAALDYWRTAVTWLPVARAQQRAQITPCDGRWRSPGRRMGREPEATLSRQMAQATSGYREPSAPRTISTPPTTRIGSPAAVVPHASARRCNRSRTSQQPHRPRHGTSSTTDELSWLRSVLKSVPPDVSARNRDGPERRWRSRRIRR
jgi:hypothetical protein